MHELEFLKDLVVILSVAVIVVILFHRLNLPSIAGFILSGILVGPQVLGLIDDVHQVEVLAEIGVALLLFGIGLELPLSKLQRLWRLAVVGGAIQVGLTATAAFAISTLLGLSNSTGILVGFVAALSSTAIVLRGLQQRGEVDAPHGRLIIGILVFQDFSVVPMMLIIPLLTGAGFSMATFALTLGKSLAIVVVVLLLAILVVPRVLKLVAQTRQRQLFVLSVFVICLGTAWLVTQSGASLAIGAFLAGLVVSGSDYRHQAMADMIAFRDIFASLFFVSVGMLLLPSDIVNNIGMILLILAGILVGKALIVFVTAAIMQMPVRACLIAALALAQIGEFSIILLRSAGELTLIEGPLETSIVSASILSMFITPFAISFGPRLAAGLGRFSALKMLLDIDSTAEATETVAKLKDHIIIAGYGFAGRELSQTLDKLGLPYVVVDINIENVRRAAEETGKALYGDITSEEVLMQLGIEHARELVVLINDPGATEHAVRLARKLAPGIFITTRTFYLLDVDNLFAAGADEVVPAEREAAVQVVTRLLRRHETAPHVILNEAMEIRTHSEEDCS